jgi:hypothetical protein
VQCAALLHRLGAMDSERSALNPPNQNSILTTSTTSIILPRQFRYHSAQNVNRDDGH